MSRFVYRLLRLTNRISDAIPPLGRLLNCYAISSQVNKCRHRPHPWSTVHNYVSWTSLTDKTWSARHLPATALNPPKDANAAVDLFRRNSQHPQRLCPKSTCLFPSFAQYLTDGFIRTQMPNKSNGDDHNIRKKNTSNHEIDLSPLYGRTAEQTRALRLKSNQSGQKGRLKSQLIHGEEYAHFLFEPDSTKIKKDFECLDTPLMIDKFINIPQIRQNIFAFGGDRANASPQVAMMNTLFLREHNRLAAAIEAKHPDWDDERVFETARNTNIVLFIKIVVEDYINHISPGFKFKADPSVAWNAPWNKPNWITTEFSLLYRWHSLIPDSMRWGTQDYPVVATLMNNQLMLTQSLKQSFIDMSTQTAGQIGPFNTAEAIIGFEQSAIDQGRLCQLASFSDYCDYMSEERPYSFREISCDPEVIKQLEKIYHKVDDVEFYVGLFAQSPSPNTPLPPILAAMVTVDAFSQALTNPLLSEHVWSMEDKAFSQPGWETIINTSTLRDIVARNVQGGGQLQPQDFIGMTRKDWQPE